MVRELVATAEVDWRHALVLRGGVHTVDLLPTGSDSLLQGLVINTSAYFAAIVIRPLGVWVWVCVRVCVCGCVRVWLCACACVAV